jgi:hypothetical protein
MNENNTYNFFLTLGHKMIAIGTNQKSEVGLQGKDPHRPSPGRVGTATKRTAPADG